MKKTILWVVGIVVVVIVVMLSTRTTEQDSSPIKIGFIGALSGDTAVYGESVRNGVQIAVEEINDKNLAGRKIELIQEDVSCSDGKKAVSAAQKLISVDKVQGLIGFPCSGEMLAVAPVSEPAKVIVFGQGSNPKITDAGEYIFRTWPSDLFAGKMVAEKVFEDGNKKVAMITENTEYATAIRDVISKEYKGTITASETYKSDVKDFRSMLTKIKQTNPDALLINAQAGSNAAAIAKQARELGMKSQFYGYFFTGPEFVKSGPAVEGTLMLDAPTLDSSNSKAAAFLAKYESKHGQRPAYPFYAGGGYDQMMLLASAFGEAGTDSDEVRSYLEAVKDNEGVIGRFGFDMNGDVVGVNLRWGTVTNGEYKPN